MAHLQLIRMRAVQCFCNVPPTQPSPPYPPTLLLQNAPNAVAARTPAAPAPMLLHDASAPVEDTAGRPPCSIVCYCSRSPSAQRILAGTQETNRTCSHCQCGKYHFSSMVNTEQLVSHLRAEINRWHHPSTLQPLTRTGMSREHLRLFRSIRLRMSLKAGHTALRQLLPALPFPPHHRRRQPAPRCWYLYCKRARTTRSHCHSRQRSAVVVNVVVAAHQQGPDAAVRQRGRLQRQPSHTAAVVNTDRQVWAGASARDHAR